MPDWEGFRGVLEELYVVENKTLEVVREIMAKEHKFIARLVIIVIFNLRIHANNHQCKTVQ